jgi:hypothetical protein
MNLLVVPAIRNATGGFVGTTVARAEAMVCPTIRKNGSTENDYYRCVS